MPDDPLTLEDESQHVLDELWSEKLIPFKLRVGKITKESDEYTIHFYDSRIQLVHVGLTKGYSFGDLVRSALLSRVEKDGWPLMNSANND